MTNPQIWQRNHVAIAVIPSLSDSHRPSLSCLDKRMRRLLYSLLLILTLASCSQVDGEQSDLDQIRDKTFVEILDEKRHSLDLASLDRNEELDGIAAKLAIHLARTKVLSHADFETRYPGWDTRGEVLYYGSGAPKAAFAAWMASSSHRVVLLNPRFRQIGVAKVKAGDTYWWVSSLGRR